MQKKFIFLFNARVIYALPFLNIIENFVVKKNDYVQSPILNKFIFIM